MKRRASAEREKKGPPHNGDILAQQGDVKITKDDVERAIEEARQRVGDEFAELLEAPAMTQEEMDAVERNSQAE